MQSHHNLSAVLAPHLESLSTASTAFLTPLTAVLSNLVTELVALRAAHHQLVTRVARIDAHLSAVLPHSIPSPPNTPSPNSPPIDPDLTQPPSPIPTNIPNHHHPEPSASSPSQDGSLHPNNNKTQPVKQERLKRRKRSSKRPCSAPRTPQETQENFDNQTKLVSSQHHPACKIEQHSPPRPSPARTPSSSHSTANAVQQHHTPKNNLEEQRSPLKQCDRNVFILPTTPTTEVKSKKRKSTVFSYEPVVEGYANAAAAAKEVDKIAARHATENCPRSFRPEHSPEHKHLPKTPCLQCQESRTALAALAPDPEITFQRLMQQGCRHKEQVHRPATPEGYWALDFAETPTQPP